MMGAPPTARSQKKLDFAKNKNLIARLSNAKNPLISKHALDSQVALSHEGGVRNKFDGRSTKFMGIRQTMHRGPQFKSSNLSPQKRT